MSHVICDEAETIFRSSIPKEWIVRALPKDYGVDYEIETVEKGVVTGKRFWMQLKGVQSVTIRNYDCFDSSLSKGVSKCVVFPADTKLLKYALSCDFPLLLGVIDIHLKEGFWLPIRDEIEANLAIGNPNWRKQATATVRIPVDNSLSEERNRGYSGLRWYAMEPARMRAFAILHHYYHELKFQLFPLELFGLSTFVPDDMVTTLGKVRSYLEMALNIGCLFGKTGIDVFINQVRPVLERGIRGCDELAVRIREKRDFNSEYGPLGWIYQAVGLLSTSISMYKDFRWRYLLCPCR